MVRLSAFRLLNWRSAALTAAFVLACTDHVPTAPTINLRLARGSGGGGPTVKATNPSSGAVSTTLSVQVTGSGFDPGSRAVWALNGDTTGTVTKVKTNSTTFVSSTELVANITIGSDASLDLYDVVVITTQGKKGIGIELFTVTAQMFDLAAGDGSTAFAINESGQIVGAGGTGVGGFIWENGVLRQLGAPTGYTTSRAYDINDAGTVVGVANANGLPQRAFVWTAAGGMRLLSGTLGGTQSEAWAINSTGDVAGSSSIAGEGAWHATLWSNGTVTDLQAPNFPTGSSYSWGMNDAGVVVGQYDPPGGGNRSFRWTAATGMVLITPATSIANALDVNRDGVTVGKVPPAGSTAMTAYRWTNGVLLNLGTLGGTGSQAIAINDAGSIVGNSSTARRGGFSVPFIWKASTGMKQLTLPPGRSSGIAWGINEAESIVGSSGTMAGLDRATLWKLH